jgi:hypothetical protein
MTGWETQLFLGGQLTHAFHMEVGMPQGSPLSPVLLALYTSPILCASKAWEGGDLSLYVDDRCVFVSGMTFKAAADKGSQFFGDVV